MSGTWKHSGRGAPRFVTGLTAEIVGQGDVLRCETANVSRSGALLRGRPGPCLARPFRVRLRSSAGDLEVAVPARVTRIVPDDDGAVIALAFGAIDREQRKNFDAWIARVREACDSGALNRLQPDAKPHQIREALGKMSLQHRILLASRAAAPERRWLRHDGDPRVLEALARNPGAGPDEALAIARTPGILPTTVETLLRDPRFRAHEELMILLASHPRSTLPQAEAAAARIGPGGRDRLLRRPYLPPTLRAKLVRTVTPSRGPGGTTRS